ncbi:MAG: RagB/SusD family nutrient uptake outer membrane protein [Bacteroidales bacterium]|nr:RagB/SusD family nutrient uptake outer membrane protein [Bacteroidales bacterium]
MKKIYIISFLSLFLLIVTGCKKDFLDVQPTQFLTQEQVTEAAKNNPDVVAGSMSGIYTLMFQDYTGGSDGHDDFGQKGYDIFSDFLSGDLALTQSSYNWYRRTTEFTATQDYTNIVNYIPWRYYYRIIRSANTVIASLGGNDVVPELKANQYIMGQAKAMRAYAYFYLTQFYATSYDATAEILPIYTDPAQQNQPKSTTQDVFNLMINDLTQADSLLGDFQRTAKHQVNKYVAEGLLAYVYAAMGGQDNWVKAKNLTADIIQNGGFTIMDSTEVVYRGNPDVGGFNSVSTPGWMWGVDLTLANGLDLVSWWGQMDAWTYSYQWAGDRKALDAGLYSEIPADDVRKGQFYPYSSSSYYLTPIFKFYPPTMNTQTWNFGKGQREVTTDYVYMRVAEMYLLNAETAAKSGDEATARTSLKDLMKLRVPNVSYIDNLTGQALLDEIYLQTRIELWGEGKSYLAMKRDKATIVRGSNHLSYVGVPIPYNDPRLTFSIPQAEILNNPFISQGNKN